MRPFRRAFGWGTFFAVVISGGLWLLALPFYPIRCSTCGAHWTPALLRVLGGPRRERRTIADWSIGDWILAVVVLVIVGVLAFGAISGRWK